MGVSCAVALVLLLDASASITFAPWQAMISGHAESLAGPGFVRVAETEGVAVTALAFSDSTVRLTPWRVLRSEADAIDAARELLHVERPLNGGTLIGPALSAGLAAAEAAPCGERTVLDLVTDGEAPDEIATEATRDRATALGVTINALGVGRAAMDWLRQHAITPGGFAVEAAGWEEFAQALRRKLVREVVSR